MRYFISTLLGLVVGLVSIYGCLYLSTLIFALPEGLNILSLESIRENIEELPTVNLLMIVLAYAIASFLAGFTSVKIETGKPVIPLFIIGGVLTALGFINFIFISYPLWVLVVGSVTFLPLTRLGGSLGLDKPI